MPPYNQQNITPSLDWPLRDWIRESGSPTIKQIIAYAASVWPIEREWPEKTVYSWVSRGIPSRDDALRIVAALRIAATSRGRTLFQGLRLFEHAEMFLYSRACLDAFRPPSLAELRQMVGAETLPTTGINDMRVLDHLSSPPPVPMIGRDLDVVRLLTECEAHPITVLHGDAGMGKTSLVWMTAQEARNVRYSMVREFDWVTLSPKTDVNDANWRALVLRNISARFRWADLMSLPDEKLEGEVAKKLRKDEVLIVFDQADSPEQFSQLLAWANELLGNGEVSGRIIIASRQTPPADMRALQLGTMKAERFKELWNHFDAGLSKFSIKADAATRDLFIRISRGNPAVLKALATSLHFRTADAPSAPLMSKSSRWWGMCSSASTRLRRGWLWPSRAPLAMSTMPTCMSCGRPAPRPATPPSSTKRVPNWCWRACSPRKPTAARRMCSRRSSRIIWTAYAKNAPRRPQVHHDCDV
ncbi:MAG: ATP-binding protein [Anaerolineae bacterium]|nr:ATP-binding protein [Anaerolineae bacterium]